MKKLVVSEEFQFFAKIILFIVIFFIIFVGINHFNLNNISINETKEYLSKNALILSKDIIIESDNKINATAYYQDTTTPGDIPIYIFTKDGFVIERSNYITGFLDTANFEYAGSYEKPHTIITPSGIEWRILSNKIIKNNKVEGAILVAYYYPQKSAYDEIDNQLINDANKINNLITLNNGQLNISNVKSKDIKYSTYYQIVDKYNKLLIDEGGPPSYIDRSYVYQYLQKQTFFEIKDKLTNHKYLFFSYPLVNNEGVILIGKSITDFQKLIGKQQQFILITTLFLLIGIVIIFFYLKRELSSIVKRRTQESLKDLSSPKFINPVKIIFDIEKSCIFIDDRIIKIEYASKQYEFCKLLITYPKKRWEYDELMDKLGYNEEDAHDRTFYDLRGTINKKVDQIIGADLISYENKTYYINPNLLGIIQKIK